MSALIYIAEVISNATYTVLCFLSLTIRNRLLGNCDMYFVQDGVIEVYATVPYTLCLLVAVTLNNIHLAIWSSMRSRQGVSEPA